MVLFSHGDGLTDGSLIVVARFWDQWLWVPMGFVQQWRSAWVVTRSCVVVGVDHGEVMHGGSDGDCCCELWLIS